MFCIFISCELIKHGRRKISWGFKLTFPLLFFTGERRLGFWPQVDGETTAQNSIPQRQSLSWKNSRPKLPRNVPYQKLISTRNADHVKTFLSEQRRYKKNKSTSCKVCVYFNMTLGRCFKISLGKNSRKLVRQKLIKGHKNV